MSYGGSPLVQLYDPQIPKAQRNSPVGSALVDQPVHLVGTEFASTLSTAGTASDNFWNLLKGTNASAATSGQILTLTSGTTNADWCSANSQRKARFVFAHPNVWVGLFLFNSVIAANTTTYFGSITMSSGAPQSGYCFSVSGTGAVSVQSYSGGSPVLNLASGFNGALGSTYTVPDTNVHRYEILYYAMGLWFFIDGQLLHFAAATTTFLSPLMTNPIGISIVNGASPTSRVLQCWDTTTIRYGSPTTRPQATYIAGNVTAQVLKTGAGSLHKVVIGAVGTGNSITIYDALTATNTLAVLNTNSSTVATSIPFDLDFFTGLTVTTTGTPQATLIYD